MARFYGSMTGSAKTMATRMGTAASGIQAHVRGWDVGVLTVATADGEQDEVLIMATGGTNNPHGRPIGTVRVVDGEPIFIPA